MFLVAARGVIQGKVLQFYFTECDTHVQDATSLLSIYLNHNYAAKKLLAKQFIAYLH